MSVFESLGETTDKASDIGEKFIETSHRYYKLKIFQQLTFSVSMIVRLMSVGAFVFVGLIFAAIAGAMAVGNALNSMPLGFFLIGVLFLLAAIIIYSKRQDINKLIIEKLGAKFFSEDSDDEEILQ